MGLSQCVEGLFHSIAQSPSSVYGVLVTFGHQSVLLYIQFKGVKVYFNSRLHGSAPHGAEGIAEGRDFHCGQHKQEKGILELHRSSLPLPFLVHLDYSPRNGTPIQMRLAALVHT